MSTARNLSCLFVLNTALVLFAEEAGVPSTADGEYLKNRKQEAYIEQLSAKHAEVLSTLAQPGFCAEELTEQVAVQYRILWDRSFHPPVFVSITVTSDGEVYSELTELDRHPRHGSVAKKISTWTDVCQFGSEQLGEDPSDFCEIFKMGLEASSRRGFWSEACELDLGFVFDGSTWIVEGRKNDRCHVVSRLSPEPESEFFQFVWQVLGSTGKRFYFDEVY